MLGYQGLGPQSALSVEWSPPPQALKCGGHRAAGPAQGPRWLGLCPGRSRWLLGSPTPIPEMDLVAMPSPVLPKGAADTPPGCAAEGQRATVSPGHPTAQLVGALHQLLGASGNLEARVPGTFLWPFATSWGPPGIGTTVSRKQMGWVAAPRWTQPSLGRWLEPLPAPRFLAAGGGRV